MDPDGGEESLALTFSTSLQETHWWGKGRWGRNWTRKLASSVLYLRDFAGNLSESVRKEIKGNLEKPGHRARYLLYSCTFTHILLALYFLPYPSLYMLKLVSQRHRSKLFRWWFLFQFSHKGTSRRPLHSIFLYEVFAMIFPGIGTDTKNTSLKSERQEFIIS